jgi:hypothetical protein
MFNNYFLCTDHSSITYTQLCATTTRSPVTRQYPSSRMTLLTFPPSPCATKVVACSQQECVSVPHSSHLYISTLWISFKFKNTHKQNPKLVGLIRCRQVRQLLCSVCKCKHVLAAMLLWLYAHHNSYNVEWTVGS